MDMQAIMQQISAGVDLSIAEMQQAMRCIMQGEATDAQIGGFLVGLAVKGETSDEIYAAAQVMRELALKVDISGPLLDTCGTGGDGKHTFNISTAVAIVSAAAGARIAKHGNRSISSRSGSADVLEAAGIKLDLSPQQLATGIDTLGIGFIFAPSHHQAMRHAIAARRELGIRSLFNILGPLANPAAATHQLLGVYRQDILYTMATVLNKLGSQHALLVCAEDGMDEISLCAPTHISELAAGNITSYTITPEQFGFTRADISSISAQDAQTSLAVIQQVLDDQAGPARDIVCLNSGAALYAADCAESIADGIKLATAAIQTGAAKKKFKALIDYTRQYD